MPDQEKRRYYAAMNARACIPALVLLAFGPIATAEVVETSASSLGVKDDHGACTVTHRVRHICELDPAGD
jgi:hypothetical protein